MNARTGSRIAIGGLIAAAVALSIAAQVESQKVTPPSRVPAIDNPGPLGLEAAYLLLAQRGRAAVLDAPTTEIPAEVRVIVTALPYSQPAGPEERSALWRWVEQGGTLVVLGDHSSSLGGLVPAELTPVDAALSLAGRDVGMSEIGSDIQSLVRAATKGEELVNVPAAPLLPDPLLTHVERLSVSGDRGFRPLPGELVPLVTGGDTPVVDAVLRGAGRAYFFAGPDVLSNSRLDRNDNLSVLANLAERGTVYFDEYHHRVGASASMTRLAGALAMPLAQLLFLGAMLVWSAGRRVGPLLPPAAALARTTGDYAQQVGQLYRRANAEAALCEDLERELQRWLEGRLAAGPGTPLAVLQDRLARREPAVAARVGPLTARLRALKASKPTPDQFADISRAVVELQRSR